MDKSRQRVTLTTTTYIEQFGAFSGNLGAGGSSAEVNYGAEVSSIT
jgi:hypothetical protein